MTKVAERLRVEEIAVLVVDDDAEDRQIVNRLLAGREAGGSHYRVLEHDGGGGLEARLREGGFDCLLLDERLGGSRGSEILGRYVAQLDEAPVVMLTADQDEGVVANCLEHGAAEFLAKDELSAGLLDRTIRYSVRQHLLRRELAESQRRIAAGERMAAIGMIAAGIAHEFNNLNMMVLGNVEYAASLIGDHPATHRLEHVMEAVERGSRITASLISMARGGVPLGEAGCDAAEVAQQVLRLVEPAVVIGEVAVTCEVDGQVWVAMEGHELQQVLTALVINALHAVVQVPAPRIELRLTGGASQVRLVVEDNGVGIDPEDRDKVFQPFFSAKGPFDKAGRYPDGIEGTGLGLSLAEHLVTRRGGTVTFLGRPGAGASVSVVVPASKRPIRADESSAIIPVFNAPNPIDLLIVDPDPEQLRLLTVSAIGDGRTVRAVSSGPEAVAAIDRRMPDAVVCCWDLDAGNGRSVIGTLATRVEAEDIDLVIVSECEIERAQLLHLPFRSLRVLVSPLGTRRIDEVISRIQSTR